MESTAMQTFGVWIAALLTLGILSFLYKDNILYKIAEAVFVGISAGYWFITYFWDNIYRKAYVGIFHEGDLWLLVGVVLGILMLLRLSNSIGWIARWPIAFIVGATAGLKLMVYLVTDAIAQVHATANNMENYTQVTNLPGQVFGVLLVAVLFVIGYFIYRSIVGDKSTAVKIGLSLILLVIAASGVSLYVDWMGKPALIEFGTFFGKLVVLLGTIAALIYFFFSKEHRGAFGTAAKLGTWILMITFGASFGYTVMSRMSLLIGRVDFLLTDWLKLIK